MSRTTASISVYSALPFTDDTRIDALLKSDVVWRGDVVGNDDVDVGGGKWLGRGGFGGGGKRLGRGGLGGRGDRTECLVPDEQEENGGLVC